MVKIASPIHLKWFRTTFVWIISCKASNPAQKPNYNSVHWHIVGIDLKYSRLRNRRGTGNKRRNWKIWKKKIIIGPWKFDKKIKVFEKKQKNRKIKQLTVEVVCIKNIGAELTHCTMGRGGVKTKWRQDACYWLWKLCVKILAAMKKDPSQFRKYLEQCFLRPDLKFFFEFQKKILFAISVTLKMTIKKYFFVKKKT